MIFIDTNALVRYFTDDSPKAQLVEDLIRKESEIFVPDAVFAELEFVLTSFYSATKEDITNAYEIIFGNDKFKYHKYLPEAFFLYKQTNVGMYDCLIATQSFGHKMASFDKKLLKLKGVKGYW